MTSVTSLIHLLSASRARRREQWLDPESLADRRRQGLHRLARVARAAPYYRELFDRAGMTPAELTEATLVELPTAGQAAAPRGGAGGHGDRGPATIVCRHHLGFYW